MIFFFLLGIFSLFQCLQEDGRHDKEEEKQEEQERPRPFSDVKLVVVVRCGHDSSEKIARKRKKDKGDADVKTRHRSVYPAVVTRGGKCIAIEVSDTGEHVVLQQGESLLYKGSGTNGHLWITERRNGFKSLGHLELKILEPRGIGHRENTEALKRRFQVRHVGNAVQRKKKVGEHTDDVVFQTALVYPSQESKITIFSVSGTPRIFQPPKRGRLVDTPPDDFHGVSTDDIGPQGVVNIHRRRLGVKIVKVVVDGKRGTDGPPLEDVHHELSIVLDDALYLVHDEGLEMLLGGPIVFGAIDADIIVAKRKRSLGRLVVKATRTLILVLLEIGIVVDGLSHTPRKIHRVLERKPPVQFRYFVIHKHRVRRRVGDTLVGRRSLGEKVVAGRHQRVAVAREVLEGGRRETERVLDGFQMLGIVLQCNGENIVT